MKPQGFHNFSFLDRRGEMPRRFLLRKKFEKIVKKYHKVLDNAHNVGIYYV